MLGPARYGGSSCGEVLPYELRSRHIDEVDVVTDLVDIDNIIKMLKLDS